MNEQEFLDFWKNHQWPEELPVTYRLYYDDTGQPIEYSMERHDGNYIELTHEQYQHRDFVIVVRDGKIVSLRKDTIPKMKPAEDGAPCHPQDITVIVSTDVPNKKWKIDL
jgi:hypothetical protein